jgi:hypothetical protein
MLHNVSCDMLAALPVKGESFVFRRNGITVLVDGGFKQDAIDAKLPGIKIDIVICTHGDQDHAGGLPSLISARKAEISQIWLPGRFAAATRDLVRKPEGFLRGLCDELREELRSPSRQVLDLLDETTFIEMEDEGDVAADEIAPQMEALNLFSKHNAEIKDTMPIEGIARLPEGKWISELRKILESDSGNHNASNIFNTARKEISSVKPSSDLHKKLACYWLSLIDTAKTIREIAIKAIENNIRIRWFDYAKFARERKTYGGKPGFLEPMNSFEITGSHTRREKCTYMELTKINKESLVFFAPAPPRGGLDVLFCADSPLGDGPKHNNIYPPPHSRNSNCLVATAPHHGSESNKIAYDHLKAWGEVSVFLRAGGSKTCPPGATFGKQAALKLCAKCPKKGIAPRFTELHWGQKGLICFSSNVCQC